jgi:hypothetical protein
MRETCAVTVHLCPTHQDIWRRGLTPVSSCSHVSEVVIVRFVSRSTEKILQVPLKHVSHRAGYDLQIFIRHMWVQTVQ